MDGRKRDSMTVTLDFKPSRHTDAYRFTTTDRNALEVLALKRQIAAHNKEVRASMRKYGRKFSKLLRVRFMGRGPRKIHAERYARWKCSFDSYLPVDLATHFDVYVHEDNTAMELMLKELETGMTQGELAKHAKLKNQMWRLELDGMCRKRRNDTIEWVK